MTDDPALDARFMRLALALGARHNGRTWPNPSVGAVVVDPETATIRATGVTQTGGRPHAEVVALEAAGEGARRATLYVSLEPCSHHGRTPPCADAIVRAGLARVVTALEDPDPRVAGRGHAILRAATIALRTGVLAADAERAHRGHLTRVLHGRPALAVKLARTRDGFAAGPPGADRLIISGERAQSYVHMLRAHADAVLVGIGTVLADDPRLDVRLPGLGERSPVRVVLDSRLRLPPTSVLAKSAATPSTWLVCGSDADGEAERRLTDMGVDVLRVPTGPDGRLDLRAAMGALAARGLTRVLSEGGPILADALAAAGLIDEVVIGTSERALGRAGLPALGPNLHGALARDFIRVGRQDLGSDLIEHYERASCSPGS